ncbi:MAG: hypothetical protein U0599_15315 [Vicinamibacteria bacterium]
MSEGAGLSVLATTDPAVRAKVAGVVAMGLPDQNELGWRFRDQMIYITKKTPNEPLFSVRQIVGSVAPVPLAIFQATHDEFVPAEDTRAIVAAAREPRRLTIEAVTTVSATPVPSCGAASRRRSRGSPRFPSRAEPSGPAGRRGCPSPPFSPLPHGFARGAVGGPGPRLVRAAARAPSCSPPPSPPWITPCWRGTTCWR